MSFERTRIYYRNPFLHIGHLNTLYHNDHIAGGHNGTCYAIIDDRQDEHRIKDIQEDFDYLGLKHIQIISVHKRREDIMKYTEHLIEQGKIYINYCSTIETDPDKIIQYIARPTMHYRLILKCGDTISVRSDPSIGYTKPCTSGLTIVLLFDYIIKVLDAMLSITDIISTSTAEVSDVKDEKISDFFDRENTTKIRYHRLDTYFIHGFKYSKKNWPLMDERNPSLLTIKGLKARHIPKEILYAFYLHATQMGTVKISYLGNLLRTHFYHTTERVQAIIHPLKIELANWRPHQTEYICKSVGVGTDSDSTMTLSPLSNILYMEQYDYGVDYSKLTKGRTCRLRHGPYIRCTDVELDDRGPICIKAEIQERSSSSRDIRTLRWISSEWGRSPVRVKFYLYNWFYTGHNAHQNTKISYGYIEESVFKDLTKVYQLEHNGYYVYDEYLSGENGIPSFICICKIKN